MLLENHNADPTKVKLAGAQPLVRFPTNHILLAAEYRYLSFFGHIWILCRISDWTSGSRIAHFLLPSTKQFATKGAGPGEIAASWVLAYGC
jgi:hypothetical protein